MLLGMAQWIKRLMLILWLLIVCIIGSWLVTQNDQPLSISVLIFNLPELTAGLYMCLIFAAGVGVGFITSFISTQGKLLVRKRALKRAEKEVSNLKQIQVRES